METVSTRAAQTCKTTDPASRTFCNNNVCLARKYKIGNSFQNIPSDRVRAHSYFFLWHNIL